MAAMKTAFMRQGGAGIVKARAVEDRLMADTWQKPDYDVLPRLRNVAVPTLIIWGDYDFIPIEISRHIAQALPKAELVTIKDCGHFAYLECGEEVRKHVDAFFQRMRGRQQPR